MQNDLISRSALIKQIDDDIKITELFMGKNPKDSEKYATLLNQSIVLRNYKAIIEDMPTAYDVISLPCKCGDSLWGIKVYKGYLMPTQGTVREMYFTKDMTLIVVLEHICRGEFGKKVFRTKEETEKAILDMGYVRSEKNPSLFKVQKGE